MAMCPLGVNSSNCQQILLVLQLVPCQTCLILMEATATASQFCTAKINNELFLKKEEMIILSETMLGTIALVD